MVTQTTKKQAKSSVTRKSKFTPIPVSSKNCEPGEEEIRELAEILYHQRIDQGEQGNAEEDWLKAEEYLRYKED